MLVNSASVAFLLTSANLSHNAVPYRAVAMARDGMLAVGDEVGNVRTIDPTGKEVTWFCERGGITSLAFSPDGKEIATGYRSVTKVSASIRTRTGEVVHRLTTSQPAPKKRRVFPYSSTGSVSWSSDGKWLATSQSDHLTTKVKIFDGNGRLHSTLKLSSAVRVNTLGFSPNSRTLLTATSDGFARVWKLDGTLKWQSKLSDVEGLVGADYSQDGRSICYATTWPAKKLGVISSVNAKPLWSRPLAEAPKAVRFGSGQTAFAIGSTWVAQVNRTGIKTETIPQTTAIAIANGIRDRFVIATKDHELKSVSTKEGTSPSRLASLPVKRSQPALRPMPVNMRLTMGASK